MRLIYTSIFKQQESTFLVEMILVSFSLQDHTQLLCVWPYHKRGNVFSKLLVCINCHSSLLADTLVLFLTFFFVFLMVVSNDKLTETSFSILEIQILEIKKKNDGCISGIVDNLFMNMESFSVIPELWLI